MGRVLRLDHVAYREPAPPWGIRGWPSQRWRGRPNACASASWSARWPAAGRKGGARDGLPRSALRRADLFRRRPRVAGGAEFEAFGEDPDSRVRAARLDEGLEVLAALWSGEPVEHRGDRLTVHTAGFHPGRCSGRGSRSGLRAWPARAPFRRAARWDGVFPLLNEVGGRDDEPGPARGRSLRHDSHRRTSGAFDVVIEGRTEGRDPAGDLAAVNAYRAAGLTWWIEKLGWFRGALGAMRDRIDAGPPRSSASTGG